MKRKGSKQGKHQALAHWYFFLIHSGQWYGTTWTIKTSWGKRALWQPVAGHMLWVTNSLCDAVQWLTLSSTARVMTALVMNGIRGSGGHLQSNVAIAERLQSHFHASNSICQSEPGNPIKLAAWGTPSYFDFQLLLMPMGLISSGNLWMFLGSSLRILVYKPGLGCIYLEADTKITFMATCGWWQRMLSFSNCA